MKRYDHPDLNNVPLSTALQALSDPCRVQIVITLLDAGNRELACSEIPVQQSKATVSHHFDTLRAAGVIETRVEGTRCLSRVRTEAFEARFPGLLHLLTKEHRPVTVGS